ncbi:M48 family metalloprotease [Fluviicola sp.]|uniref:M48 family metalloprotease n=1 Tax=Fluviicola sp. TaxID=1917219 RepID=UPI0031DBD356
MKYITTFFAFIILFFSGTVIGQKRDQVAEQAIEKELQSIAPAYVDEFRQATNAMDKGDLILADSIYSIIYEHAPSFDHVVRRLGSIKNELGQQDEGLVLCERAVEMNRSYANLITLVNCIIQQTNASTIDLARADSLLQESKLLPESKNDVSFYLMDAQIGLRLNNMSQFRAATNFLEANFKNEMATHYYAAILAANNGDPQKADKEIRIANKLGLPNEEMNAFLAANADYTPYNPDTGPSSTESAIWNFLDILFVIVIAWISGIVLLYLVGIILSMITLRSIEQQIKNNDLQASSRLRKVYKILITTAGFYYYVSLPIIVVLVLAIGGGLVFGMLSAGIIAFKLVIIIVIVVGGTIIGLLRSLLVRGRLQEPGRLLNEPEAPELFALTRSVAKDLNTRPIDEIRITPETDLAVYETGSWRAKMQDNGKRVLILGVAVLKDFRKDDFKAILAHEYGHFANRDTAGGGVAMRVQRDMTNYYIALYNSGNATWWSIAFLFLKFYHFIFTRISAGATRLQEVLADRIAAETYGAQSFRNGLTFVVRRSIEFSMLANAEIKQAEEQKRGHANFYELSDLPDTEFDLESELQKSLNRKTSEQDTHPSPVDRFRYVEGITTIPKQDTGTVHEFFTNWGELTGEMTLEIDKIIQEQKRMTS